MLIDIKDTYKKLKKWLEDNFKGSYIGGRIALITLFLACFTLLGVYIDTGMNPILDVLIFVVLGSIILFLGVIIAKVLIFILKNLQYKLIIVLIPTLVLVTIILNDIMGFSILISALWAIIIVIIEGFLGVGLWMFLKNEKKKVLSFIIILITLGLNSLGIYNVKSHGKVNEDLEKYLSLLSGEVSSINNFKNPATEGNYQVKTLYYGSGTDKRRKEYGEGVSIKTSTVSAYTFLENYKGLKGKLRTSYWGFDDKAMPINGRVWYPEGNGKFPLVLIVHGNHDMNEYSDGGYEYLGKLLASQGFITASVDENFLNAAWFGDLGGENDARAWIMLKHLDAWKSFNSDKKNPFYNKVDLDNIALIGHSRGGEAVATAALFNKLKYYPLDYNIKFNFNYNIKSVIAIAPTDEQFRPADKATSLENVNYLLLQGANDGDVSFFMGSNQYDRVKFNDGNYYFKSWLYIYGANHGQFNTIWGKEDFPKPISYFLNLKPLLTGEEQRSVAKIYISAFLKSTLKEEKEYVQLFKDYNAGKDLLPETLYVSRFEDSNFKLISNYEEDSAIDTTTLKGGIQKGAGLYNWKERSLKFRGDFERNNNAVHLKWNHNGGKYSIELPEDIGEEWNITNTANLVFSACDIDEEKVKAEKLELTDFSVQLIDRNEEKAVIPLSDISNIHPAIGVKLSKWGYHNKNLYGEEYEPVLQTYRISMMNFIKSNPNFNPKQLKCIEFLFDKSKKGDIVVDDIGIET